MSTIASYKCPNCAAPLTFTPDENGFRCEYCQSFFKEDELKTRYKDLDEQLEEQQADAPQPEGESLEGAVYYTCPSCGAEIVTDANTAATFCYYCQSPVVLGGRLSGELKPDYVIPFALSRETAIEKFKSFCGRKKFLPIDFLSDSHIEKMTGIYFPYWLTDGEVFGSYTAKGEKVRTWTTGDTKHTERKIFRLTRKGSAKIRFMPTSASKSHDKVMMKYLHPYDNSGIENFSMTYLSGFQADKRDIELAEAQKSIKADMIGYTEGLMEKTMTEYSSVRKESSSLNLKNEVDKYSLLPAWILTYKYNDKIYLYAINGQTGKTYGELPINKKKLAVATGVASAIVLAITLIAGYIL